jgi:ribosomal protein L40E
MRASIANRKSQMRMPPETCPQCGADVPPEARACPECGADEHTGWSEAARYGGLGLPDESFNYEDFVEREFGRAKPVPRGIHWFWWLVALVILGVFAGLLLGWF